MSIIPKLKKPLSSLTKIDREKSLSKLRHQQEELIDEMGQRSDLKAIPTVREYNKELEQEEQVQKDIDVESLKKLSRNKIVYQRYLIKIIERFIKEEDVPKKYILTIDSNDDGIALSIENTNFITAFKPCGIPLYDIFACKTVSVKLGNTIGKLEGYFDQSDGGILLAGKEDLKIALQHGITGIKSTS